MTRPSEIPPIRRVNRGELAEFLGVALTSVDAMVRAGMPVASRPGRGVPTIFDLLEVLRWRYSPRAVAIADPETMDPADRKVWYHGEQIRRQIQERDAELIPATEVAEAVTAAERLIAATIDRLPDEIDRRARLTPGQKHMVVSTLGESMRNLREQLAVLGLPKP